MGVAAATWSVGAVAILMPVAAPFIALGLWAAAVVVAAAVVLRPCRWRLVLVVTALALSGAAAAASHVAMAEPARAAVRGFAIEGGRARREHLADPVRR